MMKRARTPSRPARKPPAGKKTRVIVEIKSDGLKRLGRRIDEEAKLAALWGPEFRKAAQDVLDDMKEINKRERLRGLDKNGKPLAAVTYRPVAPKAGAQPIKPGRDRYGNASASAYRAADGPPLVPFKSKSRLITYFVCGFELIKERWSVRAGWKEFKDRKGRGFFPGQNKPKRDVAGLSRAMLARLRSAFRSAIARGRRKA